MQWRGKTTLSTFSTTVLCIVAASVVLLANPAMEELAPCQATESCGRKDDCWKCSFGITSSQFGIHTCIQSTLQCLVHRMFLEIILISSCSKDSLCPFSRRRASMNH